MCQLTKRVMVLITYGIKASRDGLTLAGMHALDSCRMEKKFVHYGHDVAETDTPLECGMGFLFVILIRAITSSDVMQS